MLKDTGSLGADFLCTDRTGNVCLVDFQLATVVFTDKIAEVCAEQRIVGIVLGLPVNMDGSQGFRADRIKELAALLEERMPTVPVAFFDERLSTMAAARFLNETNTRGAKRKSVVDTLSAQIILQNALDKLKYMQNN